MAAKKSGLGRGLDALFPEKSVPSKSVAKDTREKAAVHPVKNDEKKEEKISGGPMIVKISKVEPNREQPRKKFDEDALLELSESIKQYGILQPLLVSDKKSYFEIIAGERRWRAAKMAGLKEVPVVVKEFSNQEIVEISLIENIGIDPGIIIIILLIIVIVLIGSMISYSLRLSRLERKYKMFMKGSDAQSLEKTFMRKFAQIDRLYEAKENHEQTIKSIVKNFRVIFSKYGVEKYDAFDDVGGKLSFALALLDKENTGLILNAVHSRDNCFLYLKEIVKGESYVMLSQEEVEALRKAVNFGLGELEEDETDKLN